MAKKKIKLEPIIVEKFYCNICNKRYANSYNLKRHLLIHTMNSYKIACPECTNLYNRKDNALRHLKLKHK